jgi:predicted Zn-dependent protease
LGRQRASDFTKTAAARGLSETEKLRVRGSSEDFDFESVRWLENIGQSSREDTMNYEIVTENKNNSFLLSFANDSLPAETKAEVKMGRILSARLIKKYGLIKNESSTIYLNNLGKSIAEITSRQDLSFRFGILDSNEINAFACPGGFIFITRAALEHTKNEPELVGILSHEISHVVLNHHEAVPNDNIVLEIISSLLATPSIEIVSSTTLSAIEAYNEEFYEKGRDKDTEFEADESAFQLMLQLGYLPHNYMNYLNHISKLANNNTILKTHPNTLQRTKKIENLINTMNPILELKKSNDEFEKAKKSL